MNEIQESRWLKFEELRILLQGLGYETVVGYFMGNEMLDKKRVLLLLYELEEKGIIQAQEECFTVDPLLEKMLLWMGRPEKVFSVEYEENQFLIYLQGQVMLIVEPFAEKDQCLRLRFHGLSELREIFGDKGVLPERLFCGLGWEEEYAGKQVMQQDSIQEEVILRCNQIYPEEENHVEIVERRGFAFIKRKGQENKECVLTEENFEITLAELTGGEHDTG